MASLPKVPFDLAVIAEVFQLERSGHCQELTDWLEHTYVFNEMEQRLLESVHKEMLGSIDYLNEEEMKIRLVAPLLQIADLDEGEAMRVFFERPLSMEVNGYQLSVVVDCMVAASTIFKTPVHPYFFLQEFKKAKGEKRDPEAQMLVAMLAAQAANKDGQTIYGGFLIGSVWRFATLNGSTYCTSRPYVATDIGDLQQITSALKHLKAIILPID